MAAETPGSKSISITCPNCSGQALFVETLHPIPHFGNAILTTVDCRNCGFKLNDILPAEFKEPAAFFVGVRKPKDLETKIVRSSSGTVKISKLGVTIEPGMAADGFISNLEGLLDRVEAALKAFLFSPDATDKKNAEKKLRQIRAAREGKLAFKVEVLDPYGNSALIGPNVRQRKLSTAACAKLRSGMPVLELRK